MVPFLYGNRKIMVLKCGRYSSCSLVSAHGVVVIAFAWRSGSPGSIPGSGKKITNKLILQSFDFPSEYTK